MHHIEIERQGATTVIRFLPGISDAELAQFLSSELPRTLGDPVCLDFGEVDFVTAGTLGQLVALQNDLRQHSGQLSIRNVQPRVYEVFETVGLTAMLEVEPAELVLSLGRA